MGDALVLTAATTVTISDLILVFCVRQSRPKREERCYRRALREQRVVIATDRNRDGQAADQHGRQMMMGRDEVA